MNVLEQISQEVVNGDGEAIKNLVNQAVEEGIEPMRIINEGLVMGMDIIGKQFRNNEIFIPEVIMCTEAMKEGINWLKSQVKEKDARYLGKILIGTVQDDVHDIGKNLVSIMLEGAGFSVKDLGIDSSPEKFVEEAKEFQPDIVGLSALLSTTMPHMQKTIEAFVEQGYRDSVKIIVGGAPVTESFAQNIGADGYAGDAASAVELAKNLVGANK